MDVFEGVLFLSEWLKEIVAINIGIALIVRPSLRVPVLLAIPAFLTSTVGLLVYKSNNGAGDYGEHNYDESLPSVRIAAEHYIATGEGDIHDILESGKYQPRFGWTEVSYLLRDLFRHTLFHSNTHNEENIDEGYNKGNDWFEATLGKPMVYTSGIYKHGNESLMEAQMYKLDYVAQAIDLQKGDHVLDIGCGWGRLADRFASRGAKVTGITLSTDQLTYGKKLNAAHGDKVKLMVQDGMTHHLRSDLPAGGYDKITCLEMAEHVGIKKYQEFLRAVRGMLKDEGVLYWQVAGLRRWWQYEDLVWGLFMGENVFPGADASCPLGWVMQQMERAGFEIQRTQNLGSHYSRTLAQWLEHWMVQEKDLSAKYGVQAFRRWEVFLRWSVRVARQGSSTVFMITATKHGDEKARLAAQKRLAPVL